VGRIVDGLRRFDGVNGAHERLTCGADSERIRVPPNSKFCNECRAAVSCPSGASTFICSRKTAPPSPGSARNAPGTYGSAVPAAVESRLGDLRFGQLVAAGGHDRRLSH
jgi:hypothetical protein